MASIEAIIKLIFAFIFSASTIPDTVPEHSLPPVSDFFEISAPWNGNFKILHSGKRSCPLVLIPHIPPLFD